MGRDELEAILKPAVRKARETAIRPKEPTPDGRAQYTANIDKAIVDDLFAALEAQGLVVSQGWQAIETAPRDGTVVLLGVPVVGNLREDDRRVYEGRWNAQQEKFTSVNGFLLLSAATHWMPLPLPPIAAAGGG